MLASDSGPAPDFVRQAGAIVVRRAAVGRQVLLVRGSRPPRPWVFPKGHVEAGESPETAAGRELREEAGVEGVLMGLLGDSEFVKANRRHVVAYYLFEPVTTNLPHEPRAHQWFSETDALEQLAYDDLRRLLRQALSLFRSINGGE